MPDEAAVEALSKTVVWSAFTISFIVSVVMSRTNFCTMGAVADIVNMGDWLRMRMWLCAIGIAIVTTQGLAALGIVDLSLSLYTGSQLPVLSFAVGGFLFGIGMVLGSGCGSKTLLRLGGGSLKSLVVFLMLGLAAYMTIRGVFAPLRVNVLDQIWLMEFAGGQDLPRLIGGDQISAGMRMIIALVVGGALVAFAMADREFRKFDPILAGLGIGLGITALWWVTGSLAFVAEHPETLEEAFVATTGSRPESFTFVAPVAFTLELLLFWTDASQYVSVGIAAVLGMIAGSFVYASATSSFRLEGFRGPEDTANHLIGGALMGVGGVTSMGCTVGQGLSGLSTLAAGSLITFMFICAGGVVGLYYQIWRVERMV